MLRFFLVTLAAAAMALALGAGIGLADERWIIESSPEATDAQKLGASEVERAQKLAKDKKLQEAALALEAVARKWPASVHDCNLALAYLRMGELTKAKLIWDVGEQRNGARPKWCTGEISTQLSDALRKQGYVPTSIDVVPSTAIVEVNGLAMRGIRTIWLKPGSVTFTASAPGFLPGSTSTAVTAPTSRASLTLEEPKVEAPDAAVQAPVVTPPPMMPDAGVTPVAPVAQPDAGVPPGRSMFVINGRPLSRKTTAFITTLTFTATAALLGYLTYDAKGDANGHYITDPAFDEANQQYKDYALATTVLSGLAVASAIVLVYFSVTDDESSTKPSTVKISGGPGDIGIGISGTFGDGP
jgi:hypothetical protein